MAGYEGFENIKQLQEEANKVARAYEYAARKKRTAQLSLEIDNRQPLTFSVPNLPKKVAKALHDDYVSETTKARVNFSTTTSGKNRALLDAIAKSEGTSYDKLKKLGYDTKFPSSYDVTLGYGAYDPKGSSTPISKMPIKDLLKFQQGMLSNPKNKLNSSAVGKYQIIGTNIKNWLKQGIIKETDVFSPDLQDRLALKLVGNTISNYRAGATSKNILNKKLARIWDSLPYQGQAGWAGNRPGSVAPGISQNVFDKVLDTLQ